MRSRIAGIVLPILGLLFLLAWAGHPLRMTLRHPDTVPDRAAAHAYPAAKVLSALPRDIRSAYPYVNPLAPLMDGFHRVLLHGEWPAWGPVGSAAVVGAVAAVGGYWLYKRFDPRFADVI